MTDYSIIVGDVASLTKSAAPFNFKTPPFDPIEFAKDIVHTMYQYNGIGLAANQIGINYRIFALRGTPENIVAFNPKIVTFSEETIDMEEGCLSFPGLVVKIKRPRHIRARFQLPNGETVTKQYTGMTARIFQHELDHLDGTLYYNRAPRIIRDKAFKRMKKNVFTIKESGSAINSFLTDTELVYESIRSQNRQG
jgi:peptide deformylase